MTAEEHNSCAHKYERITSSFSHSSGDDRSLGMSALTVSKSMTTTDPSHVLAPVVIACDAMLNDM